MSNNLNDEQQRRMNDERRTTKEQRKIQSPPPPHDIETTYVRSAQWCCFFLCCFLLYFTELTSVKWFGHCEWATSFIFGVYTCHTTEPTSGDAKAANWMVRNTIILVGRFFLRSTIITHELETSICWDEVASNINVVSTLLFYKAFHSLTELCHWHLTTTIENKQLIDVTKIKTFT